MSEAGSAGYRGKNCNWPPSASEVSQLHDIPWCTFPVVNGLVDKDNASVVARPYSEIWRSTSSVELPSGA